MSTGLTEETWWEVTLSTGLILTLPAPLKRTYALSDATTPYHPEEALGESFVASRSNLTGEAFGLNLRDVALIRSYTRQVADKDRLTRSAMRASGHSLPTSSPSGPTPGSLSGHPENPSGRSTGARIRRPVRH